MTEEILLDELFPAEDAVMKEPRPVPPEDLAREFEEYLLDIGVRI